MRRTLWLAMIIGLTTLLLTASACSSDSGGGGDVSGDITTKDSAFTPSTFDVASGETITVANADSFDHTFTVSNTDIDVGLAAGATEDVAIDLDAGEYEFTCTIHPSMTGTLTVT